ncbi:MAG TPA: MBL fold metallo-hydrolase [Pyrinomonadaceae bacterium]|jgi:glyoxylase-like metal-dependent hydrolase (beta-lactamase superfamily II)/8-oxo-dGTP pyrophosphatase MutT (NUDIX family)
MPAKYFRTGDGCIILDATDPQRTTDFIVSEAIDPQAPTRDAETTAPKRAEPATPKDAAAVILLRGASSSSDADRADAASAEGFGVPEVFLARRSARLAFLGGFYAFPGGQRDASDAEVRVEGYAGDDADVPSMMACAARELFEELGVLVARGMEKLTRGQLASLLDDFQSERMSFVELLDHYGLHLDARDFRFVGRWVTPPFSPRRFDTLFFMADCPRKQEPRILTGEFETGEWMRADVAVERWQRGEILVAPPVLHSLKVLAGGLTADVVERFLSVPQARREPVRRIEFAPGFICFPVRTPTKPPFTTTNCYIVGGRELVVIDPASPYEDEQGALASCIDELRSEGRSVRELILTHLHPDHIGGVEALRAHLGGDVRVAAHRLTAEALEGKIRIERHIEDGEMIELAGEPRIALRAMHTPGHARGHLCFYDEASGTLITGDNIVGLGSSIIDPPEGNVGDYLRSLERLRDLPKLRLLLGAHGPAIGSPREKIDEYIAHRIERERNILAAVRAGATTPSEIVARVYTDVHPKMHSMAERSVIAHLEKLQTDGLVEHESDAYRALSQEN